MAPPTGPRAGGTTNTTRTSLRPTRGAGVGKRRATPRTDRDGDVSMDSVAADSAPTSPAAHSGRGGTRGNRGARAGKGGSSGRSSTRLVQNVRNYASEHFKLRPFNVTIKVLGLKDSKAANNPDGGLRSLLDFLERKASKERPITLSRVRPSPTQPISNPAAPVATISMSPL